MKTIKTNVVLALRRHISVDLGQSLPFSELEHHCSSNGSWDMYPRSFVVLPRGAHERTEGKLFWESSFAGTIKVNSIGVLLSLRDNVPKSPAS